MASTTSGPIDPTDRDDPDRGRLVRHHPDLDRARLAPEQRPIRKIKIIDRIAGRVGRRDIQGLEVVIDVLDLGPACDREAEPTEDIDQLVGRLGQRVTMPEPGSGRTGEGQIKGIALGRSGRKSRVSRLIQGGLERLLDCVESLTVSALDGRFETFDSLLGRLDPSLLLPQELDPGGLDGGRIRGLAKRGQAGGFQGVEIGNGRRGCRVIGEAHENPDRSRMRIPQWMARAGPPLSLTGAASRRPAAHARPTQADRAAD